jgi:hypothetical protein
MLSFYDNCQLMNNIHRYLKTYKSSGVETLRRYKYFSFVKEIRCALLRSAILKNCDFYLPWHTVPFPEYPFSQVHKKDPSIFVQFEFWSQLSADREHSLIS